VLSVGGGGGGGGGVINSVYRRANLASSHPTPKAERQMKIKKI